MDKSRRGREEAAAATTEQFELGTRSHTREREKITLVPRGWCPIWPFLGAAPAARRARGILRFSRKSRRVWFLNATFS